VSQELASINPRKFEPNMRRIGGIPASAEQGFCGRARAHSSPLEIEVLLESCRTSEQPPIAELRREIPIVEALLMKLEAIDQTWSEVDRA
jgi:hypothetical protein